MKEINMQPENKPNRLYILTQTDYKLGLGHAGGYDTHDYHRFCRHQLLAIAKRIKHNIDPVTIELIKDGSIRNISDVDEFIKWIAKVFEDGDAEWYSFSKYIKIEMEQ